MALRAYACRRPAGFIKMLLMMRRERSQQTKVIPSKLIVLAMNFTAILLLSASLITSAAGFPQKVTLSEKNAKLENVFKKITRQTGYEFLYTYEMLDNARTVTVELKDAALTEALEICFKDQPLAWKIIEKTIIVRSHILSATKETLPPIDIKGTVINEKNEPVLASIMVKGSNNGTTTNNDGYFELLNVDDKAVLSITGVSIEPSEVKVNGRTSLVIFVKTRITSQEEIIVNAGYYQVKDREKTGSISRVDAKTIEKNPVANVLGALQGRVPGMQVTQSTGVAGGGFVVQIRGRNSIANNSDPLYIIDGVPVTANIVHTANFLGANIPAATLTPNVPNTSLNVSPLNTFNMADIESVEILKDADATAIYGSRGANGVILITTKKGKAGKTKVDLNSYTGVGRPTHLQKYLNTPQYIEMRREAFKNDGVNPGPTDYDVNGTWDVNRYTDWTKELMGETVHSTDAQLSVSGGTANTTFLIGSGYHRETSVFQGDYADVRNSFHFTINHVSDNQKFRVTSSGTYNVENNQLPPKDMSSYVYLPPNTPALRNEDGSLNFISGVSDNPYAYLVQRYTSIIKTMTGDLKLSYQLFPFLQARVNAGYTTIGLDQKEIVPLSSLNPAIYTSGNSSFNTNNASTFLVEPFLEFEHTLSKGELSVLLGGTYQHSQEKGVFIIADEFNSDAQLENLGAASYIYTESSFSEYKHFAGFARIGYNWGKKYFLNGTIRRDGSSRFGPDKQFSNFGAVGAGWIFSEENFMKKHFSFLSFGKIRTSYGITGNDQIGDYRYLNSYSASSSPYFGQTTLYPTRIFNADYRWEKNRKIEAALELGIWRDRIHFIAGWYRNRSTNQLLAFPLAPTTGNTSVQANLPAIVQNTGWEFELSSYNFRSKDFSWSSSFNISIPKNKLVSYPGISTSVYANVFVVGEPLSIKKTYFSGGINPATGVYILLNNMGAPVTTPALKDKQGIVNIGQRLYGGLQNTLTYRSFQLDFFFQFVKQDGINELITNSKVPGTFNNMPVFVMGRWQKPGDAGTTQRFTQSAGSAASLANNYTNGSNRVYSDASFIRLKNVALSYQLKKAWLQKIKMENARIYIEGQNLLTITGYKGNDPETQGSIVSIFPPLRTITAGIQITF